MEVRSRVKRDAFLETESLPRKDLISYRRHLRTHQSVIHQDSLLDQLRPMPSKRPIDWQSMLAYAIGSVNSRSDSHSASASDLDGSHGPSSDTVRHELAMSGRQCADGTLR